MEGVPGSQGVMVGLGQDPPPYVCLGGSGLWIAWHEAIPKKRGAWEQRLAIMSSVPAVENLQELCHCRHKTIADLVTTVFVFKAGGSGGEGRGGGGRGKKD